MLPIQTKRSVYRGCCVCFFFKYRRNWPVVFESTDFEGMLILRDLGIEKKNHILSCFMQLHISENNWFIVYCYLSIYISANFYHLKKKFYERYSHTWSHCYVKLSMIGNELTQRIWISLSAFCLLALYQLSAKM